MPLARTIITVRRPPPHTQPFYTESPPHVARLQPRSPHCSLLVRHIHSSRLHSEDGKKQSASAASSSSTDSDTTQYWRAERIFDRIRQEQEAEHDNNGSDSNKETTKKKKPKPPLYIRVGNRIQRTLLATTTTSIDVIQHPSHLLPLLSSAYRSLRSGLHHYWTGTKLLAADVRTAYRLARKTTKGYSLSRRETRQLQRTTADLIRLVPFSIFVVVPFMELLLPVFLKLFPNMLPSTFQDSSKREQQLKRELKVRLNVAQFLTDTMERMAREKATTKGESDLKTTAEELLRLLTAARNGERLTTDQLLSVSRLFDDEITFETLSTEQLRQVCRYLNIPTYGTYGGDGIMRYAIAVKMERIHRDDAMLVDEGLDELDEEELRAACRRRGMRDFGLTKEGYKRNLQQWLDLSLNKKIPDSLLLLSRAMSLSEEPTADDIAGALRSMSEKSIDETASAAGITDNEHRLEILRRQNELIAEDEKRKAEQDKQKAEKKQEREQKERQQKIEAKVATGLARDEAERTVDSDIAQRQAAAEKQKEEKKVKEEAAEARQQQQVEKLTEDVEKEQEGKGDEKDLAELGALVEGLLAMTQPSAVEDERKRLQELLSKAESDTRKKREIEVVRKVRPPLYKMGVDDEEGAEHPIQSVNELARWHVEKLKEAEDKAGKQNESASERQLEATQLKSDEQEDADKAKAQAAVNESDGEDDTEDEGQEARDRLHKQLKGVLGKLRDRLQSVDAEIGSSLHLLHPDKLTGQLDEAELIAAVQRLHAVKTEDVSKLISRIKKLVSKRRAEAEGRTDGGGEGEERGVALSVDDITALSEQIREEQKVKNEDSGHSPAEDGEGADGGKKTAQSHT